MESSGPGFTIPPWIDTGLRRIGKEFNKEKKNETKEDDHHNRRYLRREFSYSKFEQALILPEDVVKEKISANASNGVLTIDLPKRTPEEKAKVNRIIEIH